MRSLVNLALMASLSFTASTLGMAQQTAPKIKNVPMRQTSPGSGQQMYVTYCAACHGAGGTGDGPAASALKTHPTDLTTLSQKNGGVFPTDHIASVLRLGVATPAHGTVEMPIWGDLLPSLSTGSKDSSTEVQQRILNLTNYLKKLQK
jgi:mono/diheme cytochrome c family protein